MGNTYLSEVQFDYLKRIPFSAPFAMAIIPSHLIFFITAVIIVVRLLSHEALKRLAFVGLRGWSLALTPAEVHQAVAAYSGPEPEGKQAAHLAALAPHKLRAWRHPQLPGQLPPLTHTWFAALGMDEGRWLNLPELLALMNLGALLAVSYALVGGYECLEGSRAPPSYHVTLLAACALGSALAYLAIPLARGPRLEAQLALGMGGAVASASALGFAALYASTGRGARSVPWVDLGAPLGAGVVGSVGGGSGALAVGGGVAAFMMAVGTLLAMPALRTARFFAQRLAAAEAAPGGGSRLAKAAARYGMYAPALVAALWFRPLISVTANDAVHCTRLLGALAPGGSGAAAAAAAAEWGAGVSRDCRATLPGAGSSGGEALAGLLPLWALEMLPGEGWGAYTAALAARYWISESSWLRWRCAAVVVVAAGSMLWQWRAMVQGHLDVAWREGARVLHAAGVRARAGKPPARCTAPHRAGYVCARPAPECALEERRWRALATVAQAGMQLLAVPVVLASLAVLATRGTGLGGLGLCNTVRRAAEGVVEAVRGGAGGAGAGAGAGVGAGVGAAPAKESLDTLNWALKTGGDALFGPQFDSMLQSARAEMLSTALSPALWRPVLSYLLFCTLLTWWVLGELGLMYWRVFSSEVEGREDEDEAGEEAAAAAEASKKTAADAAAAAAVTAALATDVD